MNNKTPIYSALIKYAEENNLRLHMPGHNGGNGFKYSLFKDIGKIDLTEVEGLDDLHMPAGIIEEGRRLLAHAYGAQESFFLVNGATSGIHTLFMSMADPGGKVLVPRNAHRSLFAGMVLSGCEPVYIPCRFCSELGIAVSVTAEEIATLINRNRPVEAVFITSPSYYGTTSDIASICDNIKELNIPLFVDEAHGGHFPFHDSYPKTALEGGADAVVNGLHKTLPVLNQGACLHLGKGYLAKEKVFLSYSLLTTTSPSYPILASIDIARSVMEVEGRALLDRALILSQEYIKKINRIKGLKCYREELRKIPGVTDVDPLKILIGIEGLDIDGIALAAILRHDYGIQVEISENNLILAMMSVFHQKDDWERMYRALEEIAFKYYSSSKEKTRIILPPQPHVRLNPRQAYFARQKQVCWKECKGLIAAEMVAAYPPGIPCLLPGEVIHEEVYSYIEFLKGTGARLHGPMDSSLEFIRVIDEE